MPSKSKLLLIILLLTLLLLVAVWLYFDWRMQQLQVQAFPATDH